MFVDESIFSDELNESSNYVSSRRWELPLEPLTSEPRVHLRSSIECAPELEMKILPCHPKYAFLDEHNMSLVIIVVYLTKTQERTILHKC